MFHKRPFLKRISKNKMRTHIFFTILLTLLLSSVIFAQKTITPKILRNVKSETIRDEKLETAILSNLGLSPEELKKDVRYYYNLVDLNADKTPEVIVFLFGRVMCGTSGCDAMVFQKLENRYRLITHFGPARNPIIVSQTKTKGWRDLLFYNAGGGITPGYYSIA